MGIRKLQGNEPIDGVEGCSVQDFWSWAYSDILTNTTRGVFAEFLVANALGVTDEPRVEWDAVDLRYNGKTIEVKTSAYRQSWPQATDSTIVFDIAKKRPWQAETNSYDGKETRSSDCYVFCLFTERDESLARTKVRDISAWEFYVLSTKRINEELREQKSVGLSHIQELTDAVQYGDLGTRIDSVLEGETGYTY